MKSKRLFCVACIGVLTFFMCFVCLRIFTRLLVNRYGIHNALTAAIFYDAQELGNRRPAVSIDWETLYPFSDAAESREKQTAGKLQYPALLLALEEKIHTYTTSYLPGYLTINEFANAYEKLLQWNYVTWDEYNGVVRLEDGFLTSYYPFSDTSEAANATIDFAQYCKTNGIDFLYAQTPEKICRYQDAAVSGSMDFGNQNADSFLASLNGAGVETYDFRETLHNEHLNHHALFYRTDHHWRVETGLWAARHLLLCLRERFGYDTDASVLNEDLFRKEEYPSWLLGGQGRKVTLSRAEPEDFSLLYPVYSTEIRFEIPDLGLDLNGDFSALYNMDQVTICDYYYKDPYAACLYGSKALKRIENKQAENDVKAVIVHDSFGNCVLPFLSMGVRHIDSIDLRTFTGSLERYVEENRPDIVIILYNPSSLSSSNASVFRFQ